MAWANRADLEFRFSEQSIAELEEGGAVVRSALADAEAEAAGYIGRAVSLPLAIVPDTVKRLVCVIARYNLWQRHLPEDHPVYLAYRDAVRELRDIADGRVALPIAGGTSEATTDGAYVVKSRQQAFTPDALGRMLP